MTEKTSVIRRYGKRMAEYYCVVGNRYEENCGQIAYLAVRTIKTGGMKKSFREMTERMEIC